jgi:hypothetical protein
MSDAPPLANAQHKLTQAGAERERLFRAYPEEYNDGARRGYSGDKLYPLRFNDWSLERRNAWFAGWNVGYCDRKRQEAGNG